MTHPASSPHPALPTKVGGGGGGAADGLVPQCHLHFTAVLKKDGRLVNVCTPSEVRSTAMLPAVHELLYWSLSEWLVSCPPPPVP